MTGTPSSRQRDIRHFVDNPGPRGGRGLLVYHTPDFLPTRTHPLTLLQENTMWLSLIREYDRGWPEVIVGSQDDSSGH